MESHSAGRKRVQRNAHSVESAAKVHHKKKEQHSITTVFDVIKLGKHPATGSCQADRDGFNSSFHSIDELHASVIPQN